MKYSGSDTCSLFFSILDQDSIKGGAMSWISAAQNSVASVYIDVTFKNGQAAVSVKDKEL